MGWKTQGRIRPCRPVWSVPRLGRGLTAGDFDNDGRIDLLMVVENAPLSVLHDQIRPREIIFSSLELEGTASNRDGVGARVTVTSAGQNRVAARFGGGSYMSALDRRLHFGLGSARTVDRVEVIWPSGKRQSFQGLLSDGAICSARATWLPARFRVFTAGDPDPERG